VAMGPGDGEQRRVDVLGHPGRVAADVHRGPVLQPSPELGAVFEHSVLHVDALPLVPGEGQVESGQEAVAEEIFEFAAVVGPICCCPVTVKIGSTELKEFVGKPGIVIPPF